MSTRILTGNITDISEHARPGFALQVVVTPTAITPTGIIPESVEPIETDADGNFAIEVATGVQLEVKLSDAFRRIGTTTNVGNGNIIKRGMVVPHGVSPITVQAVLTLNTEPDAPGDLITLANEHIGNQSNPHNVTAAQLHLDNVANVSPADLPISDATQIAIDAVDDAITAHTADHDNPHGVTAHQTDAYTQAETDSMVSGVTSAIAVVSGRTDTLENRVDAIDTDLGDLDTEQSSIALALSNHVADMGNPHGTTKAQLGLANADNTADVDKPVSTATQNALNLKANTADLGSAAFANTGAFATAAQGTKADSAVQPAGIAGLITDQHTHGNKAVLDGITDAKLVPQNGKWYQELRRGVTNPEWIDPPGMTIPLVTMTPDLSLSRDGVLAPTIPGTMMVVNTDDGKAWVPQEATTNLIPNPVFAVNATGWINVTRDTSWAYTTDWGYTFVASGLVTGFNYGYITNFTIPATAHTMSAIVRNNAPGPREFAIRYDGINAGMVTIAAGAIGLVVATYTGANIPKAAGVYVTNFVAGDTFNIGYFQVEQKTYATPIAVGSMGSGWEWAGGANASASNRANATVTLSLPWLAGTGLENLGSIYVRRYIDSPRGTYSGVVQLLGGVDAPPIMQMRQDLGNLKQIIGISEPTYVEHNRPESVGLADVYLGWNATQIFGETTNTGMVTQARSGSSPMWGANIPLLYIGSNSSVSPYVVAVLLFDRLLTRAEKDLLKKTPTSKLAGMGAFYALAPQAGADPGFVPTNKIAAGGTTMRNAPGTGSDTIATLNADTRVTDTTGRQNVSGVDYARVTTSVLGSGWVPLTALAAL
jgi:hypothetical protein